MKRLQNTIAPAILVLTLVAATVYAQSDTQQPTTQPSQQNQMMNDGMMMGKMGKGGGMPPELMGAPKKGFRQGKGPNLPKGGPFGGGKGKSPGGGFPGAFSLRKPEMMWLEMTPDQADPDLGVVSLHAPCAGLMKHMPAMEPVLDW